MIERTFLVPGQGSELPGGLPVTMRIVWSAVIVDCIFAVTSKPPQFAQRTSRCGGMLNMSKSITARIWQSTAREVWIAEYVHITASTFLVPYNRSSPSSVVNAPRSKQGVFFCDFTCNLRHIPIVPRCIQDVYVPISVLSGWLIVFRWCGSINSYRL